MKKLLFYFYSFLILLLFSNCFLLDMFIPSEAVKLEVTISESNIINGESFTVVVNALDDNNAVVDTFSGNVTLSVSSGTLSPSVITLSSGSGTETPVLSGIDSTETVTVTASFSGLTSGNATIEVSPPEAAGLNVQITETSITSGDSVSIDITAVDDSGTSVTDFSGTVSLLLSSGTITPSSVDISSGGMVSGTFVISGITTDTDITVSASYTGLTDGTDTVSITGASITPTQINLEVTDNPKEVNNGDSVSLSISVVDDYGNIATDYTGTINLSVSGNAELSSNTVDITSGGTAIAGPDITIPQLIEDTDITITASAGSMTNGSDTITVLFVPQGAALLNTDFSSGWGATVLSGTFYVDSRSPDDSEITVGGDIEINAGVKLVIYPGVTLDMGTNQILVHGELEIIGTDSARVKLTSSSTWGGITISGDSINTASAHINGAYIDKLDNHGIYCGTSSSAVSGEITLTNSRIHISEDYRSAVRFEYMAGGTTNTFDNNIIFYTNSTQTYFAFNGLSTQSNTKIIHIRYNTIISAGSDSSTAINTSDSTSTTYNIEHNIIAGSFNRAIAYNSADPVHNLSNNFMRTGVDWDGVLGGGTYDTFTDNLYEAADGEPDNFGGTWSTDSIFDNYTSGDFHLSQTSPFPTLSQADNISSMEGCLTKGNTNEVGAYGNGGYPPNYNE